MKFSNEEISEFCNEAVDLLDLAEDGLLKLDKGGEFKSNYDAVFRVFHSLKGGAGMVGMESLQAHMHKLESYLSETKARNALTKTEISLFLRGTDAARKLLAGEAISFDYTPEKGGTDIPKPASAAQSPADSPENAKKMTVDGFFTGPASAYIVDDESDIVELLQEMLESAGMKVRAFTIPDDLLKAVAEHRPDLILTDFKMPGTSGMEVLEAAQKMDADLPVIFLSGYLTKDVLMDAINKGAFGALDKPFRDGDVITYCMSAAKQYRLLRAFRQSMNLLLYQFTDLDDFLKTQGKEDLRHTLKKEIEILLECRRALKSLLQG